MNITFKDLIKLWGKPINQKQIDLNLPVGHISTDSRTIEKGDFFVPLVGNTFDGHDYLDMAFDIGIQAAIVSERFNGWYQLTCLTGWFQILCTLINRSHCFIEEI